jgi:adenylate cyclase
VENAAKPVAVLFADVCGSTRLYEKLGDAEALAAIESVLAEARRSVLAHQGRVVKTIGDEIMAVLPTADAAMLAASSMQQRVTAMPPRQDTRLAIRVGFHFGPAIEEAADFFGDAVNVAARMAGIAKAGQVITSGPTVDCMSPLLRADTRDLDAMPVKGKQEEIRIFQVMWADGEDSTAMATRASASPVSQAQSLTLSHAGQTVRLSAEKSSASLGRDAANDVVTADKMASRVHCRIEFRRGQFFLADESTNGTYLTQDGRPEILLKREHTMLHGRGLFCFGHTAADSGTEPVQFLVE